MGISLKPWLLTLLNYHLTSFCSSIQQAPVFLSPALQEMVHSIYCYQRTLQTTLQYKSGSFFIQSKLIFLPTRRHPSKVKPSIHPRYSSQNKTCRPVQKPSIFETAWISGQGNPQCPGVTKASYGFSRRFKSKSHVVRTVHSFYRTPALSNVDVNLSVPLSVRVGSQSSYWAAPPFRPAQPHLVLRLLNTDDFLEKLRDWDWDGGTAT